MDLQNISIKNLLLKFEDISQTMRDFEQTGDEYGKRYRRLKEDYKALLAEAERRDKTTTALPDQALTAAGAEPLPGLAPFFQATPPPVESRGQADAG